MCDVLALSLCVCVCVCHTDVMYSEMDMRELWTGVIGAYANF